MRDFSIIKQKILQYLDFKGISKYKFYQETGATNGILSQTNGISEENILRFLSVYKDISAEWLMRGEGTMLKTDTPDDGTKTEEETASDGVTTALERIIQRQAKEIARLEIELEKYRQDVGGQ